MTTPFEITTIAAKETFEVKLLNANDEPILDAQGEQISVTVYGPGSKAFSKASADRLNRAMSRAAKKGRVKLSADEQLAEQAEFLAAVTVSLNRWTYKGQSDHAARLAAYKDTSIGFIADQVQKAVGDWANFSQSAPTN